MNGRFKTIHNGGGGAADSIPGSRQGVLTQRCFPSNKNFSDGGGGEFFCLQ